MGHTSTNRYGIGRAGRSLAVGAPLLVSALALAGCMSSPTYGTGKTANMQLLEDVTGIVKLGDKKRDPIAYAPRPELVKPAKVTDVALVAPQENVIAAGNPAWPESPEARLARIKAEATANADNPAYRSGVIVDAMPPKGKASVGKIQNGAEPVGGPGYTGTSAGTDFSQRVKDINQGDAKTRKFLSEPPTEYRVAEETAPVGDTGEDEWKKERRKKREASKKSSWADFLPW